jgi:heme exporter protein D
VRAPTLGVLAPALGPAGWAAVAVALVVLAVVTVVCVVRARRLDRLHRRTDAARAGLADALEHRGTVALRVADALPDGRAPDARAVRIAAHSALGACRAGLRVTGGALDACEVAENALTRRLAAVDRGMLPPGLAAEALDAEQLVVISRRVHNDAVRDTLDLRSRRLVRWLRLAGTAPVPVYFEIADPQGVRAPGRSDLGAA